MLLCMPQLVVSNLTQKRISLPSGIGVVQPTSTLTVNVSVSLMERARSSLMDMVDKNLITLTTHPENPDNTASLNTQFYTAYDTSTIITSGGFEYTQAIPATVWTINHNLGYKPVVQASNAAGDVVVPDITHLNINTVRCTFTMPILGVARCA